MTLPPSGGKRFTARRPNASCASLNSGLLCVASHPLDTREDGDSHRDEASSPHSDNAQRLQAMTTTIRFIPMLTALLVAGCALPYRIPAVETSNGGDAEFQGIAGRLQHGPVDVLLVHGMCTHGADWARSAIDALRDALGGQDGPVAPSENPPKPVQVAGIDLHQRTLVARGSTVHATAIVWSPLTATLKQQLCYDRSSKSEVCLGSPPYPWERASINRAFKDTLLNDCLADALIYQGVARDDINRRMQAAILRATADPTGTLGVMAAEDVTRRSAAQTRDLVVISDSLGSKVAFDAIDKLSQGSSAAAGSATVERLTQVFMRANQLPILVLADQSLDGQRPATTAGVAPTGVPRYADDPLGGGAWPESRHRAEQERGRKDGTKGALCHPRSSRSPTRTIC